MSRHTWAFFRFLWAGGFAIALSAATARATWSQESLVSDETACSIGTGASQTMQGTITDSAQGLLPGASVIVECGNFRKVTVSGSDGSYTLTVPPGTYRMRAESPGFTLQPQMITLGGGKGPMTHDIHLTVAPGASTVTVTANPDYVADNSMTASKTRTPLIDTAQALSVVTSMQMEARDVQTVDQAISYTAGVNPEPYGDDPRIDWFFIRGFAENDDAVYLDGLGTSKIYSFESQFMVSPFSLQSVDIMKGPTSVLYGTNQPGGMVNLVSKEPLSHGSHELRYEDGTYDRYQGSLDFSDPLTSKGTWSYRLSGQVRSSGSQVRFAQDDLVYVEPALSWKPSQHTSLFVLGNYTKAQQGAIAQFLPAQGTLLPNPNGKIAADFYDADPDFDKYRKKFDFGGYSLQQAITDRWTFRENARLSHMTTLYKTLYGIGIDETDLRTLYRAALLADANVSHFALDNQLEGSLRTGAVQHTLLAGMSFTHQTDLQQQGFLGYDFPGEEPSIDLYQPVYGVTVTPVPYNSNNQRETVKEFGAYLQDQLQVGKWTGILAGREDWEPETLHDAIGLDTIAKNDSKFSGHAGLLYHSSIGLAPYFSYATSFDPTPGLNSSGRPWHPTTGTQYEVGAKYQPRNLNAFVTASLFDLTQNNALTTDPVNTQLQIQAGQVRSRGLEVESTASLATNLNLVGSFTHDQVLYARDYSGMQDKRPVYTPMNMASLWMDYTPSRFGVGAGARFEGITEADPANTINVPGHTVMDFEAHYIVHHLRAAISGANLLNRLYVSYCYDTVACNWGAQRTVTGTVTYQFGSILHPFEEK